MIDFVSGFLAGAVVTLLLVIFAVFVLVKHLDYKNALTIKKLKKESTRREGSI